MKHFTVLIIRFCSFSGFADGATDPIDFPIAPKFATDRLMSLTGANPQQVDQWDELVHVGGRDHGVDRQIQPATAQHFHRAEHPETLHREPYCKS